MIPTYAELRHQVTEAAEDRPHPTKGVYQSGRHKGQPHRYGRLCYHEGGAVDGIFAGKLVTARGPDHQTSILALAHWLGITNLDPHVEVEVEGAGQ